MIVDDLKPLAVDIHTLRPYADNPRNGDTEGIVESLRIHGQYRAIVVRKGTNEILVGNHTYAAAMELEWSEIAATFVECDDDEAAAIMLVDNRLNDKARYDDGILARVLGRLTETSGLAGTGYSEQDFGDLLGRLNSSGMEETVKKYGDPDEDQLMPVVKLRLPQEVFQLWVKVMNSLTGKDYEKVALLLEKWQA